MKYFRCAVTITLVILYLCRSTASAEALRIALQKNGYSILLPEAMKKALKEYDPTFSPWQSRDYLPSLIRLYSFSDRQAPSAVIGDFNGDGTIDVVLDGYSKAHSALVCVLSTAEGFKVIELEKRERADPKQSTYDNEQGLWVYLTLVLAGTIKSPYEQKSLRLKTDAFVVNYYEKASVLYYFWKGSFSRYTTSD